MALKKITEEEFLEKCRKKHGECYDYSTLNFLDMSKKVNIICHKTNKYGEEHGNFLQDPYYHLDDGICPKCANEKGLMTRIKTNEEFDYRLRLIKPHLLRVSEFNGGKKDITVKCSRCESVFVSKPSWLFREGQCDCTNCNGSNFTKLNFEEFMEKAIEKHGDRYDYSKVEYVNTSTKICIICHEKDENGIEHGEFWQIPSGHLKNGGCNTCGRAKGVKTRTKSQNKFIKDAIEIHGNDYTYEKVEYINCKKKVCVTCIKHGDFMISPLHLLGEEGCRLCGIEKSAKARTKDFLLFLDEAKNSHNDEYDYSKSIYVNGKVNLCIICHKKDENGIEHGEFWQTPNNHLSKSQGCPKCGRIKSDNKRRYTTEDFVGLANDKHDKKYDYSKVEYINSETKVCIICNELDSEDNVHGEFWQEPSNHIFKQGCPKCFREKSGLEREVCSFIGELGFEFIENNRTFIKPKEIDIFIPTLNIGIEVNGINWHSEFYIPDKNYHLNKTDVCENIDIKLIQIFEDEWNDKKEIVKSRLANILKKNENKIFARKCIIKEIKHSEMSNFLNENHLQGTVNANVKLGLFYEEELVSVMSFGGQRKILGGKKEEGIYEMLRFCNKLNTSVVGGASKLLKYFIKTYSPTEIISYADRRWSQGELYESLGFNFVKNTVPNYFYVNRKKREHRFKYRKDVLVKDGYDKNKTEHEIMLCRGLYRIYDCGSKKYNMILKND